MAGLLLSGRALLGQEPLPAAPGTGVTLPEEGFPGAPPLPSDLPPEREPAEPAIETGVPAESVEPAAATLPSATQTEADAEYLRQFSLTNAVTRTGFHAAEGNADRFFQGFAGVPHPSFSDLLPIGPALRL